MLKRSKRHPIAHWRWWQTIAGAVFVYGGFAVLLAFFPSFSTTALKVGIGLAIPAMLAAVWNWWTYHWWARLTLAILWTLQFLSIAARAWAGAIPVAWVWLAPILSAYLLAWMLPALKPTLSSFLWREQTAPQTRFGRAFMTVMITLAPVAGVLGASIGMFGSRFGETTFVLLVGASLGSMVSIGFAFTAAYQLWPERPWAKDEGEPQGKAL